MSLSSRATRSPQASRGESSLDRRQDLSYRRVGVVVLGEVRRCLSPSVDALLRLEAALARAGVIARSGLEAAELQLPTNGGSLGGDRDVHDAQSGARDLSRVDERRRSTDYVS